MLLEEGDLGWTITKLIMAVVTLIYLKSNNNKENLLFLQNRLPRTFNVMFNSFLLLHLLYCFYCILFLLHSVPTV